MKNSKVVNLVFLSAGAIIWFVALHYVAQWVGYFQLPRRFGPEAADLIHHGLPLLLGVTTFLILRSNNKSSHFVSDCLDELFRVVFPGKKEVRMGTAWVIILVVMAGIAFGALDWLIVSGVKMLIGIKS